MNKKKRKLFGNAERPRLSVFRSVKHISAQIINDLEGKTLVAASTIGRKGIKSGGNVAAAKLIGKELAEKATASGIKKILFDRGRFVYHGRVKALADAAREGGLQF
jgi:large subunit ribosomal protein L18